MLRKEESSSTQKILNIFSSDNQEVLIIETPEPLLEEETASWYDSISSSIGWLNPFKSSRPSLKAAAIRTIVILQVIDKAAGEAICFSLGGNPVHHELSCLDATLQKNVFQAITQACHAHAITPFPEVCVETHEVKPSHHVFTRVTEMIGECTHAFYQGLNNLCVMQSVQDFFAPGMTVPTATPVPFPNMTNSTTTPSSSNDDQQNDLTLFYLAGAAIVTTVAVGSILLFKHCKKRCENSAVTEKTPLMQGPIDIENTAEFYEQLRARLDALNEYDADVIKLKTKFDTFYDDYKSNINEEIMNHPVTLACRHSDEQEQIQQWFDTHHDTNGGCTCPQCRDTFQQDNIVENEMMRAVIVRKLRDFEAKVNQLEEILKNEVRITIATPGK